MSSQQTLSSIFNTVSKNRTSELQEIRFVLSNCIFEQLKHNKTEIHKQIKKTKLIEKKVYTFLHFLKLLVYEKLQIVYCISVRKHKNIPGMWVLFNA